jgi:hypothetical protein
MYSTRRMKWGASCQLSYTDVNKEKRWIRGIFVVFVDEKILIQSLNSIVLCTINDFPSSRACRESSFITHVGWGAHPRRWSTPRLRRRSTLGRAARRCTRKDRSTRVTSRDPGSVLEVPQVLTESLGGVLTGVLSRKLVLNTSVQLKIANLSGGP